MLYKITVVVKRHGKVENLLACYVGSFLVWFCFFPFFINRLACLIRYGFKYFKIICYQNGAGKYLRIFHVSSMEKSDCSRLIYYSSNLFLMGVVQGMLGNSWN